MKNWFCFSRIIQLYIYLAILSEFDNLKLGKITRFFVKLLLMFYKIKIFYLHIERYVYTSK